LRYIKVIIATDSDVEGMHIRLLLLMYFLQFFPDLVKPGYVFILETHFIRVRNSKETIYCYSEEGRSETVASLDGRLVITRFKGLGEISPDEFGAFIGEDIRLQPVILKKDSQLLRLLEFYMGKNTQKRQEFIIDHLRVEMDVVHDEPVPEEA